MKCAGWLFLGQVASPGAGQAEECQLSSQPRENLLGSVASRQLQAATASLLIQRSAHAGATCSPGCPQVLVLGHCYPAWDSPSQL